MANIKLKYEIYQTEFTLFLFSNKILPSSHTQILIIVMEIWKDIEGYEDLYEVSDEGNVRNKITGRILKAGKNNIGYVQVKLCKDGIGKSYRIHRLVAKAFIPNPDNKPEVDHIDENKLNNSVDNLRWVNHQENIDHSKSKAVNQYSLDGIYIATYKSASEAERQTGIRNGNVVQCCKGKLKTSGGFIWKYV